MYGNFPLGVVGTRLGQRGGDRIIRIGPQHRMIIGFHDLEGFVTAGDTQGVEQLVVTHAQERLRVVHQIEDQRFRA